MIEGQKCKHCKRKMRIDWEVKEEMWDKVVPEKFANSCLCLECFLYFLEKAEQKLCLRDMKWLYFGSVVWTDK